MKKILSSTDAVTSDLTLLRRLAQALIWIATSTAIVQLSAAHDLGASNTETEQKCLARTTSDSSYTAAANRVIELPFVKKWIDQLGQQRRVALGKPVDKTEFISGHCYWSLSLYESGDEQLRLWKVFRVAVTGRKIFVMNADGTYVPLSILSSTKSN